MGDGLLGRAVGRARRAGGSFVLTLPEPVKVRLIPHILGYRAKDVPAPIEAPPGEVRLLIAPANYAGQGVAWARAAGRLPGVGAVDLAITRGVDRGFAADFSVSDAVAVKSERWSREHVAAVLGGFTHVLIEAERPVLGATFAGDRAREAAALLAGGIRVAYVSHGSDLRLPSRHAALDPWSPFHDRDWELLPALEEKAAENAAFLSSTDAAVFVSTPELVLDHPGAIWLPVVVDPDRWARPEPVLTGRVPIVLHAPTNPVIKGTAAIEAATLPLHDEGVIDYRRVESVPAAAMPAAYGSSDIVLEQFRLGSYGTTAVEAMAAGRLVIGRLSDQVREHVRFVTGLEIPIVQATPDALAATLRDVAEHPDRYRSVAEAGPDFVRAVHDGTRSARVLEPFLRS